jgi:undecaprenyl pyrophosphate phosphatase UppP
MHLASLLVAGTGLVYVWMLYFVHPADPYAVVNHPWQPHVQHLHILVAPLLVFAAGLVWQQHIWSHWSHGVRQGKRTGLSLVLTLVPMVISGYLIQTAVDESWRKAWVAVHLLASGLWLAGYLAHQTPVAWSRLRRRAQV